MEPADLKSVLASQEIVAATKQAHIADAKTDYGAGNLDTEAEIIVAINATNTKLNAILSALEAAGILAS